MQKIVSSPMSVIVRTEAAEAQQTVQAGPVELDFSVLSQVGGAGPHGSWVVSTTAIACTTLGPHGSW